MLSPEPRGAPEAAGGHLGPRLSQLCYGPCLPLSYWVLREMKDRALVRCSLPKRLTPESQPLPVSIAPLSQVSSYRATVSVLCGCCRGCQGGWCKKEFPSAVAVSVGLTLSVCVLGR